MPKAYNPHDSLMIKAKQAGFRARSVYKLQEIDQKFNLIKPGTQVLDLAAAPGSWLQYLSSKIGDNGQALGLDLKEIQPVSKNITTKVADILEFYQVEQAIKSLGWEKVDLILSDVAPNTSGIKHADQIKSIELNQAIVEIAEQFLKPSGALVMKVFQGEGFENFFSQLKRRFKNVKTVTTQASRDRSREIYVVCFS